MDRSLRAATAIVTALCAILSVSWRPVAAAVPQMPQPRQFSVLDGLPSNRINAIDEDAQGYLWIATRDGLARYDGVGFRVWRVREGLGDNFAWSVHVDARDRVWIGTRSAGLVVLDAQRARFRHIDRRRHPVMLSNQVWAVTTTEDGATWFGTFEGGLYRLAPDGGMRRYMPEAGNPRSLPAADVGYLVALPGNRLWVGTKRGVALWNGRDFERLPDDQLPASDVNSLVLDDAGDLWIGTTGGAAVRRASGRIERVGWRDAVLGQPVLQMLVRDRRGTPWVDTQSGMGWERDGVVHDVPLYSNTSRGMVRPAWSTGYEDREGGLWFGSNDAGLWHLPANWRNFTVLQRRVGDPSTPANAFIHGVAPAPSQAGFGLWTVGTGGTLDWIDPETGRVEHRLASVCGTFVGISVAEDRDGRVWIGCQGQLVRFDPGTGAVRRWLAGDDEDPAPPGLLTQMVARADGTVWLAEGNAVQVRDGEGRILDHVGADSGRGLEPFMVIEQLGRAPDGGIWLAGSTGLLAWNDASRRFEQVPGAPRRPLSGFAEHARDTIWLAGAGALESYRWSGAELALERHVGVDQGLPEVAPGGLVVDNLGVVWMTTTRGLVRYDPSRARLRVYGVRDGLPSHEFSEYPLRASPLGYVAAGTADGLLLFHPQHVQWSDRLPTLAIESLSVRRGEAVVELARDGHPVLRHDDRDLRVAARLLSFTDAHAHRYRFRMAGYDTGWVDVDAGGERVFPRLPAGSYRLEVQARTADDEWSPSRVIAIDVAPPWWRTPWAVALLAVAGVLLLSVLAYAYRTRMRRRHSLQLAVQKRALAEQASLAKTRFLATLGHEVRTPMTGVLGMAELLLDTPLDERQRGYADAIRRAGDHLMRLVNDTLDLARIEAGRLELEQQPFDLRALVDEVVALTGPRARARGLAFDATVAGAAPHWLLGDATRVRQILHNLLGNAIKFTDQGRVGLDVLPGMPGVRFVVSDTGPGLDRAQQERLFRRFEQADGARTAARYGGSGLGLAICQELAAAMGGHIALDSAPGVGTDFTVDLPLPEAAAPGVAADHPRDRNAPLSVLLVEDDPTVAAVIGGLLAAQGHRVVHAPHGLAALAEVAADRFDIGLLDLDLPGIDGFALVGHLRANGVHWPLVAVTARADADAEGAARAAGFDGFLRKPLTGDVLARAIADALRREAEAAATRPAP